jgi:hypothetical protein
MENKIDLAINVAALDTLWQDLPNDIMVWNTAYADAVKDLQVLENQRVVLKATTDRKIRVNPQDYGFAKLTEDGIKAAVCIQPEIIDLEAKIVEAEHDCHTIKAIVSALDVKRSALKSLTELTLSGYIGSAAIPAGMKRN